MQSYLKTRSVWIQLAIFLGMAFSFFTVLSLFTSLLLSQVTGISLLQLSDTSKWDSTNPAMITFLRVMLAAQFLSLYIIPCFLFARISDPEPLSYLGLQPPSKSSYWILGVAALILAMPLVEYLGQMNRQIAFGEQMEKWIQGKEEEAMKQIEFMISRHSISELILNLIFIAFFAGVGEELFFRGVLQRLFIRAFRHPWAGILFTSLLFSAIHFQFFGFIPRLFLGVLLGAIYWYSGSLLPAMFAHFAYDGTIIVMAYLHPEMLKEADSTVFDPSGLAVMALGSAVAVGLIFWQMKKNSVATYADVYKNDHTIPQDFTF